MRVSDHPVVEMRQSLDVGQRLERPLDAGEQVPDGPRENELPRDLRMDVPQPPSHREPQIDQHRHHRNDHPDAPGDCHNLQPRRSGRLKQVMGADMGIHDQNRPEPDEGQGVAVQRGPAHDGDHVIGHGHGEGREEEPQDVVPVEPCEDRVRHARYGPRFRVPDRISEKIREKSKDERPENVPHGHVQKMLFAVQHGHQKIVENQGQHNQNTDIDRPDEFRVFPVLRVPHGQRDDPGGQGQVPEPDAELPDLFAVQGRPHERGHEVMSRSQKGRPGETEHDQPRMDLPDAPEDEPGDIPQQIRRYEFNPPRKSRQCPDEHPKRRAQKKRLGRSVRFIL